MKEEIKFHKESHFRFWNSLSHEEKKQNLKTTKSKIEIQSEIGKLQKVFLHTPGPEVELMTPHNAPELLYNDIIYYKNIVAEHSQLKAVLSLVSEVLEVTQCLEEVLEIPQARTELLKEILSFQNCKDLMSDFLEIPNTELAQILITGFPLKRDSLQSWLCTKTFALDPLPNMYFMRDTSMVIGKRVVCSSMASPVRFTEALIMKTLYDYHPKLRGHGLLLETFPKNTQPEFTIEGGDVLVINENLFLIGISERTTAQAVDAFIDACIEARQEEENKEIFNVLCVILPPGRSTIHLDMIFTVINKEQAVVYAPYILGRQKARVIKICVRPKEHSSQSKSDKKFNEVEDLILGLRSVGVRMDPILCGGDHFLHQQREQWSSAANFFSFAPGKAISYLHEQTLRACESAGFKIFSAQNVIKHPTLIQNNSPLIVTVEGSELSRGGGGPRCMTCPVLRNPV